MKNSIGIITRVCKSELPYLSAFVDHHLNCGVTHLYFLLQDRSINDRILKMLHAFKGFYSIFLVNPKVSPNTALENFDIKLTNTDYLLLADVDEYFYSVNDLNISDAIESLDKPDYVYMSWIMAPSDFNDTTRTQGFLGHTGKAIARRTYINKVLNPHTFLMNQFSAPGSKPLKIYKGKDFNTSDIYLVHYWGRSFSDILLKCIYHEHMGIKTSSVDELKNAGKSGSLPQRLKFLAVLNLHKRFITLPDFILNKVDHNLENELITAFIHKDEIEAIKKAYEIYKSALDYKKHVAIYPALHTLLTLAQVLP